MKLSVFIVMPFKDVYEEIYATVLMPSLSELGFDIIRADELFRSTVVAKDIEECIKRVDLVVVEATEANPNVYYELGFAASHNKEMIILTQKPDELPFDTRHIRHLVYDTDDMAQFKIQFIQWVKNTYIYSFRNKKEIASKLVRGDIFEDIFDSTSYIITNQKPFEEQIIDEIKKNPMISCFHSYNTEKGVIHWIKLCSDPFYKVFQESILFLNSNGFELIEAMGEAFLKTNPDYISLGPGNGAKDELLLNALLEKKEGQSEIFYYPVDVSRLMLSHAIKYLTNSKHIERIKERIKIKAIHTEFTKLSDFLPVFDYRSVPNLFVFLGNTLGNIQNEQEFLITLKNVMHRGDILLLEVRRQKSSLALGGHDEDQIGLSFSPLARLGVSYDRNKVDRDEVKGFSQIPKTRSLVTCYKEVFIAGKIFERVVLSCVNYYDPDELGNVLCGEWLNFKVLKCLKTDSLIYFVLQKQ